MKKPVWKKIADNAVRHVWKKSDDYDCCESPKTVVVSPNWYEENGTPICSCGEDMMYSHTEILTPVELVDAVYELVFAYKPESPAQEQWKQRWLTNAKRYGAGLDCA